MRPEAVYRMLTLLCTLVAPLPVGTTLGRLHLLWMLVSGQLLATRGAAIPGVSAGGLSVRAVRRAWAALGRGDWSSAALLARWHEQVAAEGRWQGHPHGGYHPLGGDVTASFRPRLQGCPPTHYAAEAGRALPAIPVACVTGWIGIRAGVEAFLECRGNRQAQKDCSANCDQCDRSRGGYNIARRCCCAPARSRENDNDRGIGRRRTIYSIAFQKMDRTQAARSNSTIWSR